jgi:hypothetical protein
VVAEEKMAFQTLDERPDRYIDSAGIEYNLSDQPDDVRDALAELIQYYNWNPPYPQFKTYWRDDCSPVGVYLNPDHPANRLVKNIGRDLEKRLGISQGRLSA